MSDVFYTRVPGRCYSCSQVLGDRELSFHDMVESGLSKAESMDRLGIHTPCCRSFFVSGIMVPKIGPGQIQMQYREDLIQRRKMMTEMAQLAKSIGIPEDQISDPRYRELSDLSKWIFSSLGSGDQTLEDVILWGGSQIDSPYERFERFVSDPTLPQKLLDQLDLLTKELEKFDLTPDQLYPNEAYYLIRNVRRRNLDVDEKLLYPDTAVELERAALEKMSDIQKDERASERTERNRRLLQSRPPKRVELFEKISVGRDFSEVISIYRKIFSTVQNLVGGSIYEPLVKRISAITSGDLNPVFWDKVRRFETLIKDLDFNVENPRAFENLHRIFELTRSISLDSAAANQQLIESVGDRAVEKSGKIEFRPLTDVETSMIVAPPSGKRLVIRTIEVEKMTKPQ